MNDWWRTDDWPVIEQAAEDTPALGVGASAAWTPRCRCGEPATATLVFRWEDGSEDHRTMAKCPGCMDYALDLWERLQASAPEATAGLTVLVAA